jgi:hypothetical protein
MPKPPGEHLVILKTTSRSNVEEIWRKQGWVPPSTEDPVVFKRQSESRTKVLETRTYRDKNTGIPFIERSRRCLKCSTKFKTIETRFQDIPTLFSE